MPTPITHLCFALLCVLKRWQDPASSGKLLRQMLQAAVGSGLGPVVRPAWWLHIRFRLHKLYDRDDKKIGYTANRSRVSIRVKIFWPGRRRGQRCKNFTLERV